MYITIHPSFNREETILKYSRTEIAKDVKQLQHPIARQLLLDYNISGVEITSTADIPSGTGLSTSSAYTVGLINALTAFSGKYYSQEKIARRACEVEIEELGEPIGKQDQFGTAIGGFKFLRFCSDGHVRVEQLMIPKDIRTCLIDNLMLFYTGQTHSAGSILSEQNGNIQSDEDKFRCLIQMTEQAYEIKESLLRGNLQRFGEILHEGWLLKRSLASGITNPEIDQYYELALQHGAIGGKLLGAGGGGFLLLYCDKANQKNLRSALYQLSELPFLVEDDGTKVIYIGEKDWD